MSSRELKEANDRHDARIPKEAWKVKLRSTWNGSADLILGLLTDRRIEHYEREGRYGTEAKAARLAVIKAAKERKQSLTQRAQRTQSF